MSSLPANPAQAGSLTATLISLKDDHVVLRSGDGREFTIDIRDIPPELQFEGYAIDLIHDAEGWVKAVQRSTRPVVRSAELDARIAECLKWADEL